MKRYILLFSALLIAFLFVLYLALRPELPDDLRAHVEAHYPDDRITGVGQMTIGTDRQNDNVVAAWCVELEPGPSPIVVYRDLVSGIHIREAWGYGFESCAEYRRF